MLGPITAEWVTRCKRDQASPTTSRQGGYQVVERMACWVLFSFFFPFFLFPFFLFFFFFSFPLFLPVFLSQFSGLPILPDGNWNRPRLFYGAALGKCRLATAISLPETRNEFTAARYRATRAGTEEEFKRKIVKSLDKRIQFSPQSIDNAEASVGF